MIGKILTVISLMFIQIFVSQENRKYSIPEFKNLLLDTQKVKFSNLLSKRDLLQIEWEERKTSFSEDGVQTFLGYRNHELVAITSLLNGDIRGTIWHGGEEILIKKYEDVIGAEFVHDVTLSHRCHVESIHSRLNKSFSKGTINGNTVGVVNTDVFRIYRMALVVDYTAFNEVFKNNKDDVLVFLANTEIFLNNVYERDLGVRFVFVRNSGLIRQNPNEALFPKINNSYPTNYSIINEATRKINGIIAGGSSGYDVGLVLAKSSTNGGLARVEGVYYQASKGDATVDSDNIKTIAHEVGHLFGGIHTFSNTPRRYGNNTEQTEKGRGYSVMSYGFEPRDFFSLSSIKTIKSRLSNTPYYTSDKRDWVEGVYLSGYTNIPLGIKANNITIPVIDKTKIKSEYKIPHNTFFQFYIPVSNKKGKLIQYIAQQRDERIKGTSVTKYPTYRAVDTDFFPFQNRYVAAGGLIGDSRIKGITGKFTFWLGVRDKGHDEYVSQYDIVETKLLVVRGIPFTFSNQFSKKYKVNEKIVLNWNVDTSIFPTNSKVRILLSDDFGQTFKHILVAETDNDGTEEIMLPNIEIGRVRVGNNNPEAGVIKVEVIGGLVYALSAFKPSEGGFIIEKVNAGENIGINTIIPNATLEIQRTDVNAFPQGVVLPWKDTAGRQKMEEYPLTAGLIIYDTDKNSVLFWNGSRWVSSNGFPMESSTQSILPLKKNQ